MRVYSTLFMPPPLQWEVFSFFDLYGLAQLGEPTGLTAGDKNLPVCNVIKHKILPPGIQFRKNIIQKQDRCIFNSVFDQLYF